MAKKETTQEAPAVESLPKPVGVVQAGGNQPGVTPPSVRGTSQDAPKAKPAPKAKENDDAS